MGSIPITRSIALTSKRLEKAADVWSFDSRLKGAHVAQLVEHVLGKDEVIGSIPIVGSMHEEGDQVI